LNQKKALGTDVATGIKDVKTSEQGALRQMLIEDKAAEAIRNALAEYEKLKNPPPKEEDPNEDPSSQSGTYTD